MADTVSGKHLGVYYVFLKCIYIAYTFGNEVKKNATNISSPRVKFFVVFPLMLDKSVRLCYISLWLVTYWCDVLIIGP